MSETSIEVRKDSRPILMKSKLVHWVSIPTAERLQAQLQSQNAHNFVRIAELGITINTAEVEGVYGIDQYEKLSKINQGMWECQYRAWHQKKEQCFCAREIARKHWEETNRKKMETREPTVEELEMRKLSIKKIRDNLRKNGILPAQK